MPIYKKKNEKGRVTGYDIKVNYTDRHGKYRQIKRTAKTLEEAKAIEIQLTAEVKENPSQVKRLTIKEIFEMYMEKKKADVKITSYQKSRGILLRHVIPYFGANRADRLTVGDFEQWKKYIRDKDLSLTMQNNCYKEFVALLNYAVKSLGLPENLLSKAGCFKNPNLIKKEMDYYTAEEFKKFISIALEHAVQAEKAGSIHEWHYYVFFNLAFLTGARKGEINALTWKDYNNGCIYITKNVTQKVKGMDLILPPKTKSSNRVIQLPQNMIDILDAHWERCNRLEGFTDESIICGIDICIRDIMIDKRNRSYSAIAGLKRIRIHDFRHSHVSLLANAGINIQEIARRLGHAKIEMTWNTYSHLYPQEEERAVAMLNSI